MDGEFAGLFSAGDDGEGADEGRSDRGSDGFMEVYGWHYQIALVAEYERITIAEAWNLTALNFLNDLAYLKAKTDHDRLQNEKARKQWHQ